MRHGLLVAVAATVAATVLASSLVASAAGASPGTASPDPFYGVPAGVAAYRDGQVIAARAVTAKVLDLPVPAQAWQLQYRTEDFRGRPSATVTTLLVPITPWRKPGPRPLVSYQTAEDGVDQHCAPSHALTDGLRDGFTGSYTETPLIALALLQGWAVSVPDYEGPQSTFLVAGPEARGVLDGLRAARAFAPAGLAHAPLALWGYSGGSFASVTAAQLQPAYAPELRLTALALGGLLGSIRAVIDAFSGSFAGGAIPMGITGFLRAYPELNLEQYLNPSGRAKVAVEAHDCVFEAVPHYPFLQLGSIEASPNALDAAPVAAMLDANSPLHFPGAPHVATYWYHARTDELAPYEPALATIQRFCAAGTHVHADIVPIGEHIAELALGAPGAINFLATRFVGREPADSCARLVPAR